MWTQPKERFKIIKLKYTLIHDDWYQFHFSTIICFEINRGVSFFFELLIIIRKHTVNNVLTTVSSKLTMGVTEKLDRKYELRHTRTSLLE